MSGFLKMSSFHTVTKMLYSFYLVGVGNGKNIKISYKDFVAQFNLDINVGGGIPIYFTGFALPNVNNSGAPLVKGNWVLLAPGTYQNVGGGANIIVPAQNIGFSVFDGTKYGAPNLIPIPMPTGTNVIIENGELLVTQDGVYKYVQGIKDDLSKIVEKSENLEPVFVPTSSGTAMYEASTFSGWGTYYGVFNNFDFIKVRYKDLTGLGLIDVTKVKYRVCENDQNGVVLASGEIDVDFSAGEFDFLNIQLDHIVTNPNNANIWFEFWGNGNMGYYMAFETVPARILRYRTTAQDFNKNYAQKSSVTASSFARLPDVKFYLNNQQVVPVQSFADAILAAGEALHEVSLSNLNAVSGYGVKTAIKPFEDIIGYQFVEESGQATAQRNILTNYSTFAGWGQLMGNRSGFNAVRFMFMAYDAANMPTYCTLTIRKGTVSGAILFQKRIDYNFQHNVPVDLTFELGYTFQNVDNDNLFVQYHSDGYFAAIGNSSGQTSPLYYVVAKNTPVLTTATTNQNVLRTEFLLGSYKGVFTDDAKAQIEAIAGMVSSGDPDVLLTSRVWLYPGIEYNIYNKNVVVPTYGDNLENYRLDYNGSIGRQYSRNYWLNPITAALNNSITLYLYDRSRLVSTKTQLLLSGSPGTGSGQTRNVLIVGDSTVNGSNISNPLKAVFDADSLNINLIGTLGAAGAKHEGRGGWTINDYYGTGRVLYQINVTGLTTAPGVGAVYLQAGVQYSVVEVNITGGSGYFSVQSSSSNRPVDLSGSLTKQSGTGDATITYSSSAVTPSNPFYNPATQKFDIGYYLTQTAQTLAANDWIFFQLGINDVFGITSQTDADSKTTTMLNQMNEIIANIHAYNPDIRIGIVVTFPPAGQDAFGVNYTLGQTSERYTKTGLLTWQKKLINTFDNSASFGAKTYLISAHLNIDTEYNYPSSQVAPNARYTGSLTVNQQNNGVHPAASGYAQIADMYAGAIKYFG